MPSVHNIQVGNRGTGGQMLPNSSVNPQHYRDSESWQPELGVSALLVQLDQP